MKRSLTRGDADALDEELLKAPPKFKDSTFARTAAVFTRWRSRSLEHELRKREFPALSAAARFFRFPAPLLIHGALGR